MNHWLYVTNLDNWEISKQKNILGVSQGNKKRVSQISKGDRILVYTKSEKIEDMIIPPRIVAEYEAKSAVFEDRSRLFKAPQVYEGALRHRTPSAPVSSAETSL